MFDSPQYSHCPALISVPDHATCANPSGLLRPSVVGTGSFFNSQVCPYKSQRIPPRDFRGHNPCLNIVFFVSDHRSLLTHAFVSGPLAESANRDWLG